MEQTDKMDKIKKVLQDKKLVVEEKTKELAQIARLKSQIRTCEDVIRRNQLEIGEMVYAQYEEGLEAEEADARNVRFERQCKAIANGKRAIADLKGQIRSLQKK